MIRQILFCLSCLTLTSCAFLHHHQMGEIDSDTVLRGRRFEILASQTGFSFQEAGQVAKAMTRHGETQRQIGQAQAVIGLFQMGPRTGNPVFTDAFADHLVDKILASCPKGRISGLSSTRETAKYPVVSGELVKIVGYCNDKE